MEDKSFVKRLNKKDIRRLLSLLDLEIAEELPRPIIRGKGENNEYGILVKCKSTIDNHTAPLGSFFLPMMTVNCFDNYKLIDITDFQMVELSAMQPDEEMEKMAGKMMNVYLDFMQDKFGKDYEIALSKYVEEFCTSEESCEL